MLKLAVVMNAQGVIEAWTLLAEELFGFSAEEALGKPLGDLIVPEAMRPYHEMGFKRYVQTREAHCVGFAVEIEADGFDTVGGLVFSQLGKIPNPGDEVRVRGLRLQVLSTTGRRISRLRVVRRSPQEVEVDGLL